ncbi:MAG: hypothetical protein RJA61_556 [Candidatus Parcubacteria bacterium]|jgi:hypothetical protein
MGNILAQSDIVRVDRVLLPIFPIEMEPAFPELQRTGPDEFQCSNFEKWQHHRALSSPTLRGSDYVYALKSLGLLERCLGLQDLEAIQGMGIKHFIDVFGPNEMVVAYKSVAIKKYADGLVRGFIPHLCVSRHRFDLRWRDEVKDFRSHALLFR